MSHVLKAEQFGLFLSGPVGEEVVAVDGSSFRLVVVLDFSIEFSEQLISEVVFLNVSVGLSVFGDVLDVVKVGLRQNFSGGKSSEDGGGECAH